MQPRDVITQDRQRVVRGGDGRVTLEHYAKPRVTTNVSFGGDDGVNAGVPQAERTVALPRIQQLARALAIADTSTEEGAGGVTRARAAAYVADAEPAYRFCPVQRADWWLQCFVWWDAEGRAGVIVDQRLAFGGAFAPNRFERISTPVAAWIQRKQANFDAQQPPAAAVRRWSERRRAAQQAGHLPPGAHQLAPSYLQVYIDDFTGVALDDAVRPPAEVDGVVIEAEHTIAAGGTPVPEGRRAHVHAQLAVLGLRELGLHAAPAKVVVGDPVVALGMELCRGEARLRCPVGKRELLLAAMAEMRVEAVSSSRVRWRQARSVLPELKRVLRGGYALARPAGGSAGRGWRVDEWLQLQRGGRAAVAWIELLDTAAALLDDNGGVPLAPRLEFPDVGAEGVLTVTTDASGVDGVGGYAFDERGGTASEVWLVSEKWPAEALEALQWGAATAEERRRERQRRNGAGLPTLSMPAAELSGVWAVAEAVSAAQGHRPRAVVAVGD
eukprot:6178050-Pleurochrysis_carterae.AAC.1